MASLFSALSSSAGTLTAYERALDTTQNNVSNASTPGYAAQQASFSPQSFDPENGLPGGVSAGQAISLRNELADQNVREQQTKLGSAEQLSTSLGAIEGSFDVSGQSGIPLALNQFLNGFSALSLNPNSTTARQTVIASAQQVVTAFQQTASDLSQATADNERQLQSTVSQINTLTTQLQGYNVARQQGASQDAGLDANVHATLEQLSELANISVSYGSDGTANVLLDGQTPLVLGNTQFSLRLAPAVSANPQNPQGTPPTALLDEHGNDVTAQATQGRLGGLLQVRNSVLGSLQGDPTQQGSVNQLAQAFADRVNQLLTSGNISDGPPPQPGLPLFTYNATNSTGIAQSLGVNAAVGPQQIAVINPGPPYQSNGIALAVAGLANPSSAADEVQGLSFTGFYGQIAGQVGQLLATAKSNTDVQDNLVSQARTLQSQASGVSLDQEAVNLTEFQRAYQATAKVITTLDQLTQDVIDILK